MLHPTKIDLLSGSPCKLVRDQTRQQHQRVDRSPSQIRRRNTVGRPRGEPRNQIEIRGDGQRESGAFDQDDARAFPRTSASWSQRRPAAARRHRAFARRSYRASGRRRFVWPRQAAMREWPGPRAAFVAPLRPEPADHRDEHRDRAVDDAPGVKIDQMNRRSSRSRSGTARSTASESSSGGRAPRRARGHQHVADVDAQADDDGLIGRILPERLASGDGRRLEEVAVRRRRAGRPLERAGIPWIVGRRRRLSARASRR